METILTNFSVTNRQFRRPGLLLDLDTGKKYPLKEGKQTVGRKDDDSDSNSVKPDIAIETNDMYMSRRHLHILVEEQNGVYYHKLWILNEVKNDTMLDDKILAKGEGHAQFLEKGQVISMPLAKIKIIEE